MKHVLIAHQSSIPHYRIPFYNALNRLRPLDWGFEVVFDLKELSNPTFFKEQIDPSDFKFPLCEVNTIQSSLCGKTFSYQTFFYYARKFDLLILENAVNNLTYPICHLHHLFGKKIIYWGHGKDRKYERKPLSKEISERIKLFLVHRADGFFAYSQGVAEYLIAKDLPEEKIFVLNNTIDITSQRKKNEVYRPLRHKIRSDFNLLEKSVLLYVGRLTENKRIDFLLSSFEILSKLNSNFHLILIGDPSEEFIQIMDQISAITFLGSTVDIDQLAPIYVASDLFVNPGSVGLGPLQALCYDLPVLSIDSNINHGPEIEYLNPKNSIIMGESTTPEDYAKKISNLFIEKEQLNKLKLNTWSSIEHLTIEQMAINFIEGVNKILKI